ncbi:MAG TPA: hypothetical protein VFE01_02850 [Terracidiphilus sp.]|nr:hypothetical protein [Terracidiphilus sp.]
MKSPINVLPALAISVAIVVPVGSFVTRSVVDTPAWQRVGPVAWATFSRQADLRNGEVLYPILGIGSTVLAVALAAVNRLNRAVPKSAAVPIYSSALFAIGVILETTQAAPQMLSLTHLGNDAVAIQHALNTFARWQAIRTACIALGYVSNLWALLSIVQTTVSPQAAK